MPEDPQLGAVPAREGSGEEATPGRDGWFRSPERLDVVDSTNRYLAERAREGAPEGSAVLAERQTAGRGRLGRRWIDAPGGSVLCSMLFRPVLPLDRWHLVSWVVALAARDACADAGGVDLSCKWPNDLQFGDRKVAGLLAETVVQPAGGPAPMTKPPALVVGIGINCNWPADWPSTDDPDARALTARATSLDRVAGRPIDREAVTDRLLDRVAERYSLLIASPHDSRGVGPVGLRGAASVAAEYRRNLATIGCPVRVELADESFTGTALDVDDGGRLLVDVGMCIRVISAGDIVHLR
jgi:BirA family transcriptional regulator, biotin operon repressor / biotin---[acetyl-CoA-carboxylase] ligase